MQAKEQTLCIELVADEALLELSQNISSGAKEVLVEVLPNLYKLYRKQSKAAKTREEKMEWLIKAEVLDDIMVLTRRIEGQRISQMKGAYSELPIPATR